MKVKEAIEKAQGNEELWQQLDAALQDIETANRPPNAFTKVEYAAKKGLNNDQAYREIAKLVKAGKLRKEGQGNATFYVLVR